MAMGITVRVARPVVPVIVLSMTVLSMTVMGMAMGGAVRRRSVCPGMVAARCFVANDDRAERMDGLQSHAVM